MIRDVLMAALCLWSGWMWRGNVDETALRECRANNAQSSEINRDSWRVLARTETALSTMRGQIDDCMGSRPPVFVQPDDLAPLNGGVGGP